MLVKHKQSDHFIEKSETCLQAIEAMTFVCDGCEEKAGMVKEAYDESDGQVGNEAICQRAQVPACHNRGCGVEILEQPELFQAEVN